LEELLSKINKSEEQLNKWLIKKSKEKYTTFKNLPNGWLLAELPPWMPGLYKIDFENFRRKLLNQYGLDNTNAYLENWLAMRLFPNRNHYPGRPPPPNEYLLLDQIVRIKKIVALGKEEAQYVLNTTDALKALNILNKKTIPLSERNKERQKYAKSRNKKLVGIAKKN